MLLAFKKMRTCTCLQQVGKLVGTRECSAVNIALTRLSSRQRLAQTLAAHELCVSALPSFSGRVSGADAPVTRYASLQRAMQSARALRGLHVARARRSSALRELAEQQQERREVAEEAQTATGSAANLVLCVGGVLRQCLGARQFERELVRKKRTG